MNTDHNNEEFPRLTPPEVVYEHKASLKKPVVIPLYAKVIAAAAAVALLFGIFWQHNTMPKQELLAELKPVEAKRIVSNETFALAESQAHFVIPKKAVKPSLVQFEKNDKRNELPMLAELQPKTAHALITSDPQFDELLAYNPYIDMSYNVITSPSLENENFDDRSLISRGIAKMTDGECDSFADILVEGLRSVKVEMSSLAMTIQSSRNQLRQREH